MSRFDFAKLNGFVLHIIIVLLRSTITDLLPPPLGWGGGGQFAYWMWYSYGRKETSFNTLFISVVIFFTFFVWGSIVLLSDVVFTVVSVTEKNGGKK